MAELFRYRDNFFFGEMEYFFLKGRTLAMHANTLFALVVSCNLHKSSFFAFSQRPRSGGEAEVAQGVFGLAQEAGEGPVFFPV